MGEVAIRPRRRVDSYDKEAPTPEVGSIWVWRPESDGERLEVTEVKWNGEEWWVKSKGLPMQRPWPLNFRRRSGEEHWNDLSVFWEAVRKRGKKRHDSVSRYRCEPLCQADPDAAEGEGQ